MTEKSFVPMVCHCLVRGCRERRIASFVRLTKHGEPLTGRDSTGGASRLGDEKMLATDDKDFGTPERKSDKLVTLEVDGCIITVPEGTSVMRAAALANIAIPK